MAESPGELELYNQWFSLADRDRDGSISGAEAVQFFQLSGLPQHPTLFKVRRRSVGCLLKASAGSAAGRLRR